MHHELIVVEDAAGAAEMATRHLLASARAAIAGGGRFRCALSGGRTPLEMFRQLRPLAVPWNNVEIFQVDERIAPRGHEDRNLTHLLRHLGAAEVTIVPMPVEVEDLETAADDYAARLPERFGLVHLGLGADGHCASLVPGDPVLDVRDRAVAVTTEYEGRRRMTLTFPALAQADEVLWLVTGADKRDALARLLANDPSIPAGRVEAHRSTVIADAAACGDA